MGALASGLQGVGSLGTDIAAGRQNFQDWRTQQAFNQLALKQGALNLAHIQSQLKQANQPQLVGTTTAPDGALVGLVRDPATGQIRTQVLMPGMDAAKAQSAADSIIKELPANFQGLAKQMYQAEVSRGNPQGGIDILEKFSEKFATENLKPAKAPTVNWETGIPVSIDDGKGQKWDINDPNLPKELQPLAAAAWRTHTQKLTEQAEIDVRKNAEVLSRMMSGIEAREKASEQSKIEADAIKASKEARDASIAVNTAKERADRKESYSDMSLIFDAARTNVQGAGRMTQVEVMQQLKVGSFGRRFERWYDLASQGKLPDADRREIYHLVVDGYISKRDAAKDAWTESFPNRPMPPWLTKRLPEEEASDLVPEQ